MRWVLLRFDRCSLAVCCRQFFALVAVLAWAEPEALLVVAEA